MASTEKPHTCGLCPNKPGFSDLSHLLTHLASKGHLSHEFKAKMRAEQDPSFKHEVDSFEAWKREKNLNRLLNDRILQKEKKKGGGRQQQRSQTPAAQTPGSSSGLRSQSHALLPGAYAPTAIDPMLTDNRRPDYPSLRRSNRKPAKRAFSDMRDIDDYESDDLNEAREDGPAPYPSTDRLGRGPAMHRSVTRTQGYLSSSRPPSRHDSVSPMLPPDQTLNRRDSDASMVDEMASRSSASTWGQDYEEEAPEAPEALEAPNEYAILKGTIWPGMNLFDSASAHAKRIRNQKKASSTLVAMQVYSETIEPLETIRFNPSWEVKKTREITGQVDSSEEETNDPASKTQYKVRSKRAKLRQPLTQQDKNQQILKNVAVQKNGVKAYKKEIGSPISSIHQHTDSLPRLNSGLPTSWHVDEDEMDEMDEMYNMAFGTDFREQHRPRLGVFRDSLPALERSHSRQVFSEDADMFANSPTPRPQLPPFRTLTAARTPTPQRSGGIAIRGSESASTQGRRENAMPVIFDRESMQFNGLASMGSAFGARNEVFGYHDQCSQRYFNASAGSQTQFANAMPAYMDFAIGHQQSRLMSAPGTFSNDMYNNFDMNRQYARGVDLESRSMNLDNPLATLQSNSSMDQSPAAETSSPVSKNPLFDFTKSLGNNERGTETDEDTLDDDIGESA